MTRKASRHQGIEASSHRSTTARGECSATLASSRRHQRGFTLTELMVAVAVLVVVIIATSKIFGTASKVTGMGQGVQSLLQEAAAIERQIRQDIARLTGEGFLTIHNVSVRNDVHFNATTPLLDPNQPPNALIRCDQLMFFANGVQSIQAFRSGMGSNHRGQGTASRVLYSHAFQLVNARGGLQVNNGRFDSHDANIPTIPSASTFTWNNQIPPWFPDSLARPVISPAAYSPNCAMTGTVFQNSHTNNPIDYDNAGGFPTPINAQQPISRQWLLVREALVLADDEDFAANATNKVVFLDNNRQLYTIFPWNNVVNTAIRKGRVDAVAEQLSDIRQQILWLNPLGNSPVRANWMTTIAGLSQRGRIMRAMYYPRAERKAPSMSRVDQALTNNVLGAGCSSFRVDWTYASGTGAATNSAGTFFNGVYVDNLVEQPWFGLQDVSRGVYNYGETNAGGTAPQCPYVLGTFDPNLPPVGTIYPNAIETNIAPVPIGVRDYWAVFGYNQNTPLDPATGQPWAFVPPIVSTAYTPLPTALRITMVLHDPDGKIEGGREFQFVVDLPRRVSTSQ